MNVTEPKRLTNMLGSRKTAIIEPSRTVLVIINMQSNLFSLEERYFESIVNTTVNTVKSFREANIKILWVNSVFQWDH
ncbi:hypothetical protein N8T08_008603 [Aspergillus melleus]|uniref:Uncharacterized protein n=1 Tax=Aspergillus melleus TaxID=138277 RepID=A0ACC3BDN9_9EURO|nr:hypothetical protein N8T08_008603 [Aspergillus melleus]